MRWLVEHLGLHCETPTQPNDTWVHSSAVCNPRNWSANSWHHLQAGYSRDNVGNVTYQSVWLDGVEAPINATASSAFALGWSPVLLTNFQVDGLNSGSNTVYLDNLTISRWYALRVRDSVAHAQHSQPCRWQGCARPVIA